MSTPESTAHATPTPRMRRRTKLVLAVLAALAVIFTPLAVNGLFAGALANADTNIDTVPAAIVNDDEMTTTTAADGTQTVNFAGRAVVTELTGTSSGFDWQLTNADDAAAGLADGTYYAVLTIPKDFSATINTLATPTPEQGLIDIRTDASHGYLSGVVASTVASAVQAGFGQTVTAQVVNGIYTSFGTVGTSLTDAANGATQLATGADGLASGSAQLADGLNQLGAGATTAASGATQLSDGVAAYTGGVSSLSTGLDTIASQTSGLGGLNDLFTQYSSNVSAANTSLQAGLQQLATDPAAAQKSLTDAATSLGTAQYIADTYPLGSSIGGLGALSDGIAQAAAGADTLAANGPELASGASGLADGVSQLAAGVQQTVPGAQQLSSGATQLGDGARTLASGLQTGADQLGGSTSGDTQAAADVIAQPVKVDVSTANQVTAVGQIVSTILLPTALWIGALALFLWLRPFSKGVLASSVSTARLTVRTFGRAAVFAAAQAALLVAFLHLFLGVAWSSLPATLGFSLIVALAFTAFHQLLTTAFGRVGAIVSLVLLALQLAATGGLYPVELLSGPFQAISAISPLAYAVSGIQTILTGGDVGVVLTAALVMGAILVASILLSGVALARRRRPVELGWLVPRRTPLPAPPRARAQAALRPGPVPAPSR
ncbi:YhgE/Pip family protein [Herbiconiux sp. YIM B11900]|uniref:YhgE/Pip family protein n=1 Tax=Herbiconiux sp. YIM B11900 TaxID=3404131 RepID=UPI003F877652